MYLNFFHELNVPSPVPLRCALLQIGNQIVSVLLLLKTSKRHLRSWDVFLRVLQVYEESIFCPAHKLASPSANEIGGGVPSDPLLLVCVGVLKSLYVSSLTSEQSMQTRQLEQAQKL